MPALNNSAPSYHYWLVASWLVITLVAAGFFMSEKVVEFDPDGLLTNQSPQEIIEALQLESVTMQGHFKSSNKATLYHIKQADCRCNSTSEPHIQTLNEQAQALGMQIIDLQFTQHLQAIIPSTPATLITNNQGELVYLGPYGQGFACTEKTGVVTAVLNNLQKGFNSALVLNQAKGCYCASG